MEQVFQLIIHYVLPATVLLGVLIFVHECGHFTVAKLCGVRVLKFSIGFGPKLFGRTFGETEYVLSLLPLGGYVKPLGEGPDEEIAEEDRPYSLTHQSIPVRFAVLVAGSLFNLLFAAVVFSVMYMVGIPTLTATVGQVMPDSPAARAGLQEGDRIESIDGLVIESWEDLSRHVHLSHGAPVILQVRRHGREVQFQLRPEETETLSPFGEPMQSYKIGITSSTAETAVVTRRYNPVVAVWKGVQDTWKWSKMTIVGIGVMLKSPVERRKDIGGPILIGKLAGDFARVSIMSFVMLMAMISVNLGVLNLLPIPILDGGHIFFLCIEAAKGSPVNIRKMEIAQQIGLAVLLTLMVFVFYNDITRLIP